MLDCVPCGHGASLNELGDFCMTCGERTTAYSLKGPEWNVSLRDAVVLNWMAQCERRICFSMDSTECMGLSALEYAWKALNHIYEPFGLAEKAMRKVELCVRRYLDANLFVDQHREGLKALCHFVLKDDKEQRRKHGRVSITDPEGSPLRLQKIMKAASGCCLELRDAMASGDAVRTVTKLVRRLYVLRNARIHGHADAHSVKTETGGSRVAHPKPVNEFGTVLSLLYELDISLLADKSQMPQTLIRGLVESRVLQFVREIVASAEGFRDVTKVVK